MVEFTIEVKGLKQLEDELLGLGAEIAGKELRNSLNKAGKVVLDAMRQNVPQSSEPHAYTENGKRVQVEPGNLKRHIKRRSWLNRRGNQRSFRGDSVAKVSVGVRGVPYVGSIEFGDEHRRAQPFIRRSLLENVDKVVDTFRTDMRRRINKRVAERGMRR